MFTCMTKQYFTVMLCLTWARFIPNTAFTMNCIVDQLAFVEHLGIFSLPEVAGPTPGWFFSPSRTSHCSQRHCYMLTRGEQCTACISLISSMVSFVFFRLIWRGISRSYCQSFGARIASVAAYYGQRCPDWNQFLAMTNSSGLNFQCHAWTLTIFLECIVPATVRQSSSWKSCLKIFLENICCK